MNDDIESLRERARALPTKPGVYRFLDGAGDVVYVGKARELKKRVSSYFSRQAGVAAKQLALVRQVRAIEVTVTRNETEALLLESNLIKELKPRYNVVFRDDKSYPYIHVSTDAEFPRLSFHRGARPGKGRYFGPYPNAGAVRSTLNLLQKLFLVRQCEESYFKNRSRPCLQYQIQRCTAPCVGLVDSTAYREDVEHAIWFLEGRSQEVVDVLVKQMESASASLDFERAAQLRDQITKLQRVRAEQHVDGSDGDFDVVVCRARPEAGCVAVFFIRAGRHLGHKVFFPAHSESETSAGILGAFLAQFYLVGHADRDVPPDIIVSEEVPEAEWLAAALGDRRGSSVRVRANVRGERAKWIEMGLQNADLALAQRLAENADQRQRAEALAEFLDLEEIPDQLECFDISHTRGEATVASCVVFGADGPRKSDYRRFNINDVSPGDDYAAMDRAIRRRYTRVKKEEGRLPDVLLVDGGKGQVGQALAVLEELQLNDIRVLGVAKGTSRKPGLETLIMHDGKTERRLDAGSGALHLIQHIRDEAHRFAITAHRNARARNRGSSPLDEITGVGAKRRQRLMQHFGGMQGVERAGVDDLSRVPGISRDLAQKIYDQLHGSQ